MWSPSCVVSMQVEILSISSHTRSVSLPPAIITLLEFTGYARQRPVADEVPTAIVVDQCSWFLASAYVPILAVTNGGPHALVSHYRLDCRHGHPRPRNL